MAARQADRMLPPGWERAARQRLLVRVLFLAAVAGLHALVSISDGRIDWPLAVMLAPLYLGVAFGSRMAWLVLVILQALPILLAARALTFSPTEAAIYLYMCLVELITVTPALRGALDPGWWHRRRQPQRRVWLSH